MTEVAIIGGGPSGSILGALLSREGIETSIYDRATFPRKKLCGEFIAPNGHQLLADLGLSDQLKAYGATEVDEFEMITRDRCSLTGTFSHPGLSLSRKRLDMLLLQHADSSGARVHTNRRVMDVDECFGPAPPAHRFTVHDPSDGGHVTHTETARLIIGSYGRRTTLDRKLNRSFLQEDTPYVGAQKHFHIQDPSRPEPGRVKLYLIPGGYCGVVRIERDLVNVCLLVHRSALPDKAMDWSVIQSGLLSNNRALFDLLQSISPAENGMRTVAQVPLWDKGSAKGPVLFTGDAGGMVAPLTGSGQAGAIHASFLLARIIKKQGVPNNKRDFEQLRKKWKRTRNATFSAQISTGRILNSLLQYDRLAGITVKFLRYNPSITSHLMQYVMNSEP